MIMLLHWVVIVLGISLLAFFIWGVIFDGVELEHESNDEVNSND